MATGEDNAQWKESWVRRIGLDAYVRNVPSLLKLLGIHFIFSINVNWLFVDCDVIFVKVLGMRHSIRFPLNNRATLPRVNNASIFDDLARIFKINVKI